MRITSKGQVTIPIEIRKKAGLLPHTEVVFELDGNAVRILTARIVPARKDEKPGRGARIIAHLRGRGDVAISNDETMALTRGRLCTPPGKGRNPRLPGALVPSPSGREHSITARAPKSA